MFSLGECNCHYCLEVIDEVQDVQQYCVSCCFHELPEATHASGLLLLSRTIKSCCGALAGAVGSSSLLLLVVVVLLLLLPLIMPPPPLPTLC